MEEEHRDTLKSKLGLFYTHLQQKEELKNKFKQMRNEEALKEEIKKERWSVKKVETTYRPTIDEFNELFGK
jgi:hypothetical protein